MVTYYCISYPKDNGGAKMGYTNKPSVKAQVADWIGEPGWNVEDGDSAYNETLYQNRQKEDDGVADESERPYFITKGLKEAYDKRLAEGKNVLVADWAQETAEAAGNPA